MTTPVGNGRALINIGGIAVETFTGGSGPAVFFLHGGFWLADEEPFVAELSNHASVIAPNHPGFGASDAPGDLQYPDDLAYFYLDMIDSLDLDRIVVAGASLGGWVAAEMAVKNCSKIAGLVLVDALGIRPGGRNDRDIVDIFGVPDPELAKLAYRHPPPGVDSLRAINDDNELRRRLRARDAMAHYGWQPYMHNPRLLARLHRISAPTLVLWGDSDGIVKPDYGHAYAQAIPGADFELIANAGHMAHVEQPQAVAERIAAFARGRAAADATV